MKVYRAGWLTACAAALLIGVGAAIHRSMTALPAVFVVVAIASSMSMGAIRMRGGTRSRLVRARILSTCALIGGITAVALVGLAGAAGPRVALLGVVVVVSSPLAVRAYGRWLRSVPTPSAAQLDAFTRVFAHADMGYVGVQLPLDPRALTDEQLCRRWRASCLVLRGRPSTDQLMREVEQRQIYLDEFERRYPGGYAAWLTSGAGTLDYLTPYAIRGRVAGATVNWDELTRGRE
jgi:hypothetical protein